MDFLKNLTIRQWLIIFFVVIVFIVAAFYFLRTPPRSQSDIDLEFLMRQGTAPISVDEALTKSEVEALMKQGKVAPSAEQPINKLSDSQRDELLKLMSAPRK